MYKYLFIIFIFINYAYGFTQENKPDSILLDIIKDRQVKNFNYQMSIEDYNLAGTFCVEYESILEFYDEKHLPAYLDRYIFLPENLVLAAKCIVATIRH